MVLDSDIDCFDHLPSSSKMVTVAVDGGSGLIPDGAVNAIATANVSFPSSAMLSSIIVKLTQASVLPTSNEAESISTTKSSLEAIRKRRDAGCRKLPN